MTEYPNETLRLTVQRQDNPPAGSGFTQPSGVRGERFAAPHKQTQ